MMQQKISPAFAIGAALYKRGSIGYVCAIDEAADGRSFVLGRGMAAIQQNITGVFDGYTTTVPDGIAAPWLEEAQRMGLEPISSADVLARMDRAQQAMAETKAAAVREREDAQARAAAFKVEAQAKMPAGAKAVIVAEFHRDDSDSMTDYFNHRTERTVILAWSFHARDLFPELRKAAANFPETADLATAPEKAEHREKYSMGAGFYLKNGFRDSTGWAVKKVRLYDHGAAGVPVGEWALAPVEDAAAAAIAAPVGVTISEHVHTAKGFTYWIVSLAERVERDEYDRLLAQAKAAGGWYARPWQGVPGGFAFKRQEAAQAFAGALESPEPRQAPGVAGLMVAKVATARLLIGPKLREIADRMDGEIADKFRDRRSNTPKQQREAQSARLEGYRLQRTQQGLRAIADHLDAGTLPPALAGVTTKAAAYGLARGEIKSSGGYYDAGHETGNPASSAPAAVAFWGLCAGRSEAEKAADDLRQRIEALKFANIPGFFPTPPAVLAEMVERARLSSAFTALEPEAGAGAICDAIMTENPVIRLSVFERHHSLRQILKAKGYDLTGDDFMDSPPELRVDRVLMNPPFENGQDIDHVRRAFEHLNPGGRLVAVMSTGPFFRQDRKASEFRDWFDRLGGEKTALPEGAFKVSGTGVATCLVVIDRE